MFILRISNEVTMVKAIKIDGDLITFMTRKEGSSTGNFTIKLPPNNLNQNTKYERLHSIINSHLHRERKRMIHHNIEENYYNYSHIHGERGSMHMYMAIEFNSILKEIISKFSDIITFNSFNKPNLEVKTFGHWDAKPPKVNDPHFNGIYFYSIIDGKLVMEQCTISLINDKEDIVKGYNIKGLLNNGYSVKITINNKKVEEAEKYKKLMDLFDNILSTVKNTDSQTVDMKYVINEIRGIGYKPLVKGWQTN